MLLALDDIAREDGSLISFIALVSGLFLLELVGILLRSEDVVRLIDAALGSLLLLFEFLKHRLDPFVLIVSVPSGLCILLPDLFVALGDLSLAQLLLGLFHESLEHLFSVFLAFLSQVLLHELVEAHLLGLVQKVVAI